MNEETKAYVRWRAGQRCEYCSVRQTYQPDLLFHIEHIQAKQHGGSDELENLALACHFCNYRKGPNLAGLDPDTGALTRLFHPRLDFWGGHFRLEETGWITGLTAIGLTTVFVLAMNAKPRVDIRREGLRLET